MNSIHLIGRIGKDIELKATESGNSYVRFSLACNRMDKNKTTDWFDLIAWNKTAEIIAQYCTKGKMIAVTGQMQIRSYTDNEGKNRRAYEVMVNSLEMLGGEAQTAPAPQAPDIENVKLSPAPQAPQSQISIDDEKDASGLIEEDMSAVDLPFEV